MHPLRFAVLPSLLITLLLTGCGATPITQSSIGTITGSLYGGRQPIAGAQIYLFAAGTSAYAGNGIAASTSNASTSLLTSGTQDTVSTDPTYNDFFVTTNTSGNFSISGDYTCAPGTQVYLYSTGGNPGAGINSAAGLLAILGNCPTGGSLASQVPFVDMNELSTVAAAYAFAGFATDATHISTAGSALAQTGIKNAFANSAQLYLINGQGGGPAGGGSANLTTPGNGTNGGTGSVPQSELNALANILAACVNSIGSTSPACTALLGTATNTGLATGKAPTDTATAAINIAHFPASNVASLFNIQPVAGNPYAPALAAAPANWTVSLAFTGANIQSTSSAGIPSPHSLAVDGSGNIWIANVNSGTRTGLIEFSPLGVPANASGYTLGNYYPTAVAIDAASANVYIPARSISTVYKYNIAANTVSSQTVGSQPTDLALDGSGDPWVVDYSQNSLYELNTSGAIASTYTGNGLSSPLTVAIQPGTAGNVWVSNRASQASAFTNAGAAYAEPTGNGLLYGSGNAIDANGSIWFAEQSGKTSRIAPSGTSGTSFSVGSELDGVAIDGGNNAWFSDRSTGSVYELSNAGTALSGTSGFALNPATFTSGSNTVTIQPDGIALDGSGNVWYTSANYGTLRELIGAAVPVVTPIAAAVANSTLGTRP